MEHEEVFIKVSALQAIKHSVLITPKCYQQTTALMFKCKSILKQLVKMKPHSTIPNSSCLHTSGLTPANTNLYTM